MQLKTFKPITPSLRHRKIVPSISHDPFKPLIVGKASKGFRNNRGRITVRHRGGGHKRSYRIIDWQNLNSQNAPFEVLRWDYDPSRSGLLALCKTVNRVEHGVTAATGVVTANGGPFPGASPAKAGIWAGGHKYFYILASQDVVPGTIIRPQETKIGNTLPLQLVSIGSEIHNIEAHPGHGGKYSRAAGSSSILLGLTPSSAIIQLPSSQVKHISPQCRATLGRVANPEHNQTVLGKAGASRWLGRRPVVRGEVTNPIDHPHGGKTRGGRPLKNIWGKLAKWVPSSSSSKR